VPAHVTVLYPFLAPDRIGQEALHRLAGALLAVPRFEVRFTRVEWFADSVVWLAAEWAEPFRSLTAAVWRAFPDAPPYGGAYADVVPHLTVGDGAAVELLREAADRVRAQLPIHTSVTAVQLICGSAALNSWHPIAELPLGS